MRHSPHCHTAALLVAAGENIDRLGSEASFAHLCATAPVPASSGRTSRHRLNFAGNRAANRALHMIVLVRLRYCEHPQLHGPPPHRRQDQKVAQNLMFNRPVLAQIVPTSGPTHPRAVTLSMPTRASAPLEWASASNTTLIGSSGHTLRA